MFCSNCGKQIPDGSGFCTYCGARQGAAAPRQDQPRPAAPGQAQQSPAPKKKSFWKTFIISVLAFFVAAALGRSLIARSFQETESPDLSDYAVSAIPSMDVAEIQYPDGWDGPPAEEENSAYEELFDGTRIIHMGVLFAPEIDHFAKLDPDTGAIVCRDYGHDGDRVVSFAEAWYFDTTGQGEAYIQSLNEAAAADAAAYSSLSFAKVTYSLDQNNGRFLLQYTFTGLDNAENCQAMYDAGITTDPNGLSMSSCEQRDLADGFVKK